jgi:hypothetical protein
VLAIPGTAGMLLVAPRALILLRWTAAMAAAGILLVPWIVSSYVLVAHPLSGIDWSAPRAPESRPTTRPWPTS